MPIKSLNPKNIISALSFNSNSGNKKLLVVICIVIAALIVDTSFGKIFGLIEKEWAPREGVVLFILVATAYVLGQYIILDYVKKKGSQIIQKVSFVRKMFKITKLVQHILTAITVFVILQIVLSSYYYTAALTPAITISCSLGATMMVILAHQFFKWYKSNKDRLFLLYGSSCAMIAINLAFILVIVDIGLLNTGAQVTPHSGYTGIILDHTPELIMLNSIYFISAILSFILLWGASSLNLRHYSRLHKFKFWAIVSLPLVFFLVQYIISYLELFVPLLSVDPVFFAVLITLIFTLTLPVGGILFGFSFLATAKSLPSSSVVRNYIAISAYGFILFFVSDQTSIVYASYPPFGLATISLIGLSSYLILVGIYSSAISLSQDARLRQSIYNSAVSESRLIGNIGAAQTEQELQKRIVKIVKKYSDSMTQQTGIEPSLGEDKIKQYIKEVLKEMKSRI
jgi:hypothetical protein